MTGLSVNMLSAFNPWEDGMLEDPEVMLVGTGKHYMFYHFMAGEAIVSFIGPVLLMKKLFQRSSAAGPAQPRAGTYTLTPSPVLGLTSCPRWYLALQDFCSG